VRRLQEGKEGRKFRKEVQKIESLGRKFRKEGRKEKKIGK
jgi:hypothetical protein